MLIISPRQNNNLLRIIILSMILGLEKHVIKNPIKFEVPIPCKGKLNFFEVEANLPNTTMIQTESDITTFLNRNKIIKTFDSCELEKKRYSSYGWKRI